MIDKKKLIEELLDCAADTTDTETQITSLTMAAMLMNQVLDEALTTAVVGRSEQLVCKECGHNKKAVNTTLKKICCAKCRSFAN